MGPIIRKQGDGVLGSQIAGTVRASKACRRCHDARRKCVALARDIGCVRCKGFQLVCKNERRDYAGKKSVAQSFYWSLPRMSRLAEQLIEDVETLSR